MCSMNYDIDELFVYCAWLFDLLSSCPISFGDSFLHVDHTISLIQIR